MKCKVYITSEIFPDLLSLLPANRYDVTMRRDDSPVLSDRDLETICNSHDAIITNVSNNISSQIIKKTKRLKVISNIAVGFDNIDVTSATHNQIAVTITPDTLDQSVAEFAVGLLLNATKNVGFHQNKHLSEAPKPWAPTIGLGLELRNRAVGIIGLGNIGKNIGSILHYGFGMKINYLLNKEEKRLPYPTSPMKKEAFFKNNDIFIISCPLNEETKHLINGQSIKMMPQNSILVNVARGGIIDQKALEKNLDKFRALALDVATPDPLPKNHPLWKNTKLFITPHIGSATEIARRKMCEKALLNVLQVVENGYISCPNTINSF